MKRRFTLLIAMVMMLTAMATNVFASSANNNSKVSPKEWQEWFNKLSEEEQKSVDYSPEIKLQDLGIDKVKEYKNDELSYMDIAISAAIRLNSSNEDEDILKKNGSKIEKIASIYDSKNTRIAYYITFSPTGYAIVNNNPNNPELIEFGYGKNEDIEEVLNNDSVAKYFNQNNNFEKNNYLRIDIKSDEIYDIYTDLKEDNQELLKEIRSVKESIKESISLRGKGGYGFYDWGQMPSGNYESRTISGASSTDWITTGEVSDLAKNHCGATSVTNIALYFNNRGYSKLKINGDKCETFKKVHAIVGNGPVMTIAGDTKTYFSNRGYELKYSSVNSFDGIKNSVRNDRITGILLANGIVDWHWVLGVGYREYSSGDKFIRIVNGWNNTIDRFYKPGSGSLWISATEYWIR